MRLADPEASSAYSRRDRARAAAAAAFTDWHDVRDTITDQARTNTIIIGVNTLLALIAVGFTVATVISGRVLAQRREIGLLKAIGVTPRGVVALLVAEYVALALAAGLLGLLAGHADRAAAAGADVEPAGHADPERLPARHAAGALALIVAAVALFAALPALRAGRLNSVDALALGRAVALGRRQPRRPRRRRAAPARDRPARRQGRLHQPQPARR